MKEEKRNKKLQKLQAKIEELKAMDFKPNLAKSWNDLSDKSMIYVTDLKGYLSISCENEQIIKKLIATVKLYDLMKKANGSWVANFSDVNQSKYSITSGKGELITYILLTTKEFISLKDIKTREHFLKHHKELLNDYFMH